MKELLEKEQTVSVVPQDFRNALKGKVVDVNDEGFELQVTRKPEGIILNNLIEFYSQTKNGVLYFQSDVVEIKDYLLKILNPVKHKFLQRRKFTRIKFEVDINMKSDKGAFDIRTIDLSAGGMKITATENLDIDLDYHIEFELSNDKVIKCIFEPIRIEKQQEGKYRLSGRFKNLSNIDKMTLVQYCMKETIEKNSL